MALYKPPTPTGSFGASLLPYGRPHVAPGHLKKVEVANEAIEYMLRAQRRSGPETGSSFQQYDQVVLHSLNAAEYNGITGVVEEFMEETRRFKVCLDRDSKSISLDPKNLLHRYYGIEVVFQPTQPSHILSIDDIFDAWRTLSKFQINKWVNFKTQMSRTKKPFLRHVEKCMRIRHFDVEKLDDYDIADLFKDYDKLFHCKKCLPFSKVLSNWKLLQSMAEVWVEFSDILFAECVADLPKNWEKKYKRHLRKFSDLYYSYAGKSGCNEIIGVEMSKSGLFSEAKLPPFRILYDRSLKILEIGVNECEKTARGMYEHMPNWAPTREEMAL